MGYNVRCARLEHSEMGGVHGGISVKEDAHGGIGGDDVGCEGVGDGVNRLFRGV